MSIKKDAVIPAIRGLSDNAQKIARWVRPLVFGRSDPINKMVLHHINVNEKHTEVASFDLEDTSEKDIISLANEIDTAARTDSDGIGGLQRYIIKALIISDDAVERQISRLPFRIRTESEDDSDPEMGSEPATPKGLVSQAQRFAEGAVRMSLGASGQIIATLQRQNASLQSHIEKLNTQQLEMFDTLEELRSMKTERDIQTKDAELKQKIKQDAYDKLAMLAPVVVNKIAGRKLLPEKLTPVQQMLKQLAESITPDQMNHFRAILSPEQLIVLAEFMEATQKEDMQLEPVKKESTDGNSVS